MESKKAQDPFVFNAPGWYKRSLCFPQSCTSYIGLGCFSADLARAKVAFDHLGPGLKAEAHPGVSIRGAVLYSLREFSAAALEGGGGRKQGE